MESDRRVAIRARERASSSPAAAENDEQRDSQSVAGLTGSAVPAAAMDGNSSSADTNRRWSVVKRVTVSSLGRFLLPSVIPGGYACSLGFPLLIQANPRVPTLLFD